MAKQKAPRATTYPRDVLKRDMQRSFVTEPLLSMIKKQPGTRFDIIIVLNEYFEGGAAAAGTLVRKHLADRRVTRVEAASTYLFTSLTGEQIQGLAQESRKLSNGPIYKIWWDHPVEACLTNSISTVKADAGHRSFKAMGQGIVWAVLDTGIEAKHPHFAKGTILKKWGKDLTDPKGDPHRDKAGHGTHVAGIIAGSWTSPKAIPVVAVESRKEGSEDSSVHLDSIREISGIAPEARLVSMKVLDDTGKGTQSSIIRAIEEIQKINDYGRWIRIHGVNLSLGYEFDARWFGCGQSPICVEVNRLVKSGVVVVAAAGNSGYSAVSVTDSGSTTTGYRSLSIYDPGNAEGAITVGATHRDAPHTYGVSYFSSRGPTGDGRLKPDLVAPGERIISCGAGSMLTELGLKQKTQVLYLESSGTSMAAPHVSGAVAAFLSVRREFIGKPEKVKEIFLANTIDLGRERSFQGQGMLDLMKVLQAV